MKKVFLLISFIVFLSLISSCSNNEDNMPVRSPEFSRGEINDSEYKSTFSNIGFKISDSWTFVTEYNKESDAIVDMVAKSGLDKVFIEYIDVTFSELTAKDCIEHSVTMLSDIGWEYGEVDKMMFCGQEYAYVDGSLSPNNHRIYARQIGNYILYIDIFYTMENIEKIESMFYELNDV